MIHDSKTEFMSLTFLVIVLNKKAQLTQGLRVTAPPSSKPEIAQFAWFARYSLLNYTVTLKLGLGVTQGHRKWHYSIEHIRLYIRLPYRFWDIAAYWSKIATPLHSRVGKFLPKVV